MGIGESIASVAHILSVIEKHFTLDRKKVLTLSFRHPREMHKLVFETEQAWKSLGKVYYGPSTDESQICQKVYICIKRNKN